MRFNLILITVLAAAALSACGRVGPLERPSAHPSDNHSQEGS